jgi:hypothetical protein
MRLLFFLREITMPFKEHPELARMIIAITVPTCAACLLQDSCIGDQEALFEIFEQTALQATRLARGICRVCHECKIVIDPA